MIASDAVIVNLSLRQSDEAFKADSTIAGRPAAHREVYSGNVVTTVAITDDALRPAPRQYRLARQLLDIEVTYGSSGDAQAQRDRAADVLTEIVPSLAREADPLPDIDDQGLVRYVSTPLTPGNQFVDLPLPVQALQLCTIMQENPTVRVAPARVEVRERGECRVVAPDGETIVVDATDAHGTSTYPDRIAGRPARADLEVETVVVRLRDDAQVELRVAASDPVALAEKLVPLLLSP